MYIRGAVRRNLSTTMFYATAVVSVLTVAAPNIIGCPQRSSRIGADTEDDDGNADLRTENTRSYGK